MKLYHYCLKGEYIMKSKKLISYLLLAALALSTASCGGASGGDTADTTDAVTTDYYDSIGMPNFNGETITILCRTGRENEVGVEAENGEIVNDAVFARNRKVEDGLGVKIEPLAMAGGWSERATFTDYVSSTIMAGDDEFQAVLGYMHYMPALILDNLFLDINSLPHLDLDNDWWVHGFIDNASINGKVYTVMGDMCLSMLDKAVSVFANCDLIEKYGLPVADLYTAVREGKWTFDMMTGIAKNASVDLNGDSKITGDDQHGLGMDFMSIRSLTTAFACDYTSRDEDGLPVISLYSDRFVSAFEMVHSSITSNWFYTANNNYTVPEDMIPKFKEGRTMFLMDCLGQTGNKLRDMEQSFAIVPSPKLDEAQDNYRTESGDAISIMMVPTTVKNKDLCGAVLECINYESQQIVLPAYFESTFQAKYARDEDSQEMMEIIRDTLYFDFGYIFAGVIGNDINKTMDIAVNQSSIASTLAKRLPGMEENLNNLLEFYRQK